MLKARVGLFSPPASESDGSGLALLGPVRHREPDRRFFR